MDRARRVAQIWNWLPAFRAVAETEHLPSASKELGVSASALSRTVALLEEEMGQPLFRRVGRRIELNEMGRRLLASVRTGMRGVHDALGDIQGSSFTGGVLISSTGLVTRAYLPRALASMSHVHPRLRPEVVLIGLDEIPTRLLQGRLDLALCSVPTFQDGLETVHLADERNGVYCGPNHPLYRQSDAAIDLDVVLEHPFVAPPVDAHGRTREGWPEHLRREVTARVGRMQTGMDMCSTGTWLAVLPDVVARLDPSLRRLPLDVIPPTPVYSVLRATQSSKGPARAIVDAIRAELS